MKELPTDMVEGIDNLPRLLLKKGPLSSFCMMDDEVQEFVLSIVLGEASPLITLILERAKVSAVQLRYSMHLCMSCIFLIKEL